MSEVVPRSAWPRRLLVTANGEKDADRGRVEVVGTIKTGGVARDQLEKVSRLLDRIYALSG